MADLADSWRRLLAQQNVTTGGQGITPQQAAALQYGSIMGNYEAAASREAAGLNQKQLENQKAYQEGSLALGGQRLGLESQRLALQNKQFQDQMALQREQLAEQTRQNTGWLGLGRSQLDTQVAQNQRRYNMMQDMIAGQNAANTIKGAISLPIAGMQMYGLGKQTGLNDYLSSVVSDFGIGKS